MKNSILFSMAIVLLFSFSCSKKIYVNPYSDSAVIKHDAQGLVTLRGVSDEYPIAKKDEGKEIALKNAHKKAIQQLFYMGFAGTDFKNGMIRKGISVETQHKAFFDKFWDAGYKQFITNSDVKFYGCKANKNCVSAVSEFTINYNALRAELEKNKVLNKIGF